MAGTISHDRSERDIDFVALVGEHDSYTQSKLEDSIVAELRERLAVVADLRRAEFVDSTIISMLLRADGEARLHGATFLVLANEETGPAVRKLLELTGLRGVFRMASSREEAVRICRSDPATP